MAPTPAHRSCRLRRSVPAAPKAAVRLARPRTRDAQDGEQARLARVPARCRPRVRGDLRLLGRVSDCGAESRADRTVPRAHAATSPGGLLGGELDGVRRGPVQHHAGWNVGYIQWMNRACELRPHRPDPGPVRHSPDRRAGARDRLAYRDRAARDIPASRGEQISTGIGIATRPRLGVSFTPQRLSPSCRSGAPPRRCDGSLRACLLPLRAHGYQLRLLRERRASHGRSTLTSVADACVAFDRPSPWKFTGGLPGSIAWALVPSPRPCPPITPVTP